MNNSKTSLKSNTSLISKVTTAVKSSINTISRSSRFVNVDGTIAESRATYNEFRMDIIKSNGFGC